MFNYHLLQRERGKREGEKRGTEEEKSKGDGGRGGGGGGGGGGEVLSDAGDEEVDVKVLERTERVQKQRGREKKQEKKSIPYTERQGESRGHGVRCGAELTRRRANTHCHIKVSGTVSLQHMTCSAQKCQQYIQQNLLARA